MDTKRLIEVFVTGYNREFGCAYGNPDWLDKPGAASERVEVIYSQGTERLAIEHTLVQPFPNEKRERVLLDELLPAKGAPVFSEFYISVGVPVGALSKLKKGERRAMQAPLKEWVESNAETLTRTKGWQYRQVRLANINITMSACFDPQYRGSTGIIGTHAPIKNSSPLIATVRTALERKLSKLVGTPAEKRILLLEKDLRVYKTSVLAEVLRRLDHEFPDLKFVDEIWHLDTSTHPYGRIASQRVRPFGGAFFA